MFSIIAFVISGFVFLVFSNLCKFSFLYRNGDKLSERKRWHRENCIVSQLSFTHTFLTHLFRQKASRVFYPVTNNCADSIDTNEFRWTVDICGGFYLALYFTMYTLFCSLSPKLQPTIYVNFAIQYFCNGPYLKGSLQPFTLRT